MHISSISDAHADDRDEITVQHGVVRNKDGPDVTVLHTVPIDPSKSPEVSRTLSVGVIFDLERAMVK